MTHSKSEKFHGLFLKKVAKNGKGETYVFGSLLDLKVHWECLSASVKVMIMSRYRFRPYVTERYRFRANVTQRYATIHQRYPTLPNVTQRYTNVTDRYRPLLTVTDRYRPLLTVTEFYRYLRYKRYRS